MKLTYNIWWHVFQTEYRIKTHDDVKESGIYYNGSTRSLEAHFKPHEHKRTKVITRIEIKMLQESDSQMASRLVKELAGQLNNYYERSFSVKVDVPQFERFSHEGWI